MNATALRVEDLCKTYSNGKTALKGASLAVPQGSFCALLGPNGAGKTTMINILADVVHPSSGRAYLFDRDIFTDRLWCKRHMGVVPQEIAFDPFFAPRDILALSAGLYGHRPDMAWIEELLEHFGLAEHAEKSARQLSGGMRRRLLVAQALVHRPPLVILDEPTAGVDVELRRRLWDFMRELNRNGTTILLTTHYLEEAEALCDHVAIINGGRLICAEPMRDLLAKVAASHLWLRYGRVISLTAEDRQALASFQPWLGEGGHVLCLSLMHDIEHHSTFHLAYTAAVARFGPPEDAGVSREDLEDVFVRLIHDQGAG